MKVIGLTGGIASGKSTVAALLAERGAAIVDADVVARQVVEPGQPAYEDIVRYFGSEILAADGALDRVKLGARIFADEEARVELNSYTHPRIRQRMRDDLEALRASDNPPAAAVLVIPLLFENRLEAMVEETWLVYLDPTRQLERLMNRNGYTRTEAEQRIAAQMPLSEKAARSTRLIDNNCDQEHLALEVDRVWRAAGLA